MVLNYVLKCSMMLMKKKNELRLVSKINAYTSLVLHKGFIFFLQGVPQKFLIFCYAKICEDKSMKDSSYKNSLLEICLPSKSS